MLGTDFKAGQTKFKTAAVEYIRSLGMCPKVSYCTSIVPHAAGLGIVGVVLLCMMAGVDGIAVVLGDLEGGCEGLVREVRYILRGSDAGCVLKSSPHTRLLIVCVQLPW